MIIDIIVQFLIFEGKGIEELKEVLTFNLCYILYQKILRK